MAMSHDTTSHTDAAKINPRGNTSGCGGMITVYDGSTVVFLAMQQD